MADLPPTPAAGGRIGFVGLGALGRELALRLQQRHAVLGWDLSAGAQSAFREAGGTVAATLAELGRQCEVIHCCLPRSADVRSLLFGELALAAQLRPGTLMIDHTSGVPQQSAVLAAELAKQGVAFVDAAVSASPQVVPTGAATLLISGRAADVERATGVLRAITEHLVVCGDRVGDGQATKLVNNAINGAVRLGTLELTALGRKAGLPLARMAEHFDAGRAANQTTSRMLPALVRGQPSTNFGLALMLKDVNQALAFGMGLGVPMPVVAATRALFQAGLNLRGPQAQLEDMVGVVGDLAATSIGGAAPATAEGDDTTLATLDTAIAALCRAATLECVLAGLKSGLRFEVMRDVLARTSGWSDAGRRLLGALPGGGSDRVEPLQPLLKALHRAGALAIDAGAPLGLLGAAMPLYEAAAAQAIGPAVLAHHTRLAEAQAGVRVATLP